MSTNKKALVLGGKTGLVGQALVKALLRDGWEVSSTDRKSIDFFGKQVSSQLKKLLKKENPDCVFNTVAYTQVDAAEDNPKDAAMLNNTLPALLVRLLKQRPCRLVHFSTDFVFDGKRSTPYTEDIAVSPLCVYGKTKAAGEQAVLQADLPGALVIRTAWLFGPGKKNFVQTILSLCAKQLSLGVVDDQIGSPTYTTDLADYVLQLVAADASGLFHVANTGQASWCELACEAISIAQADCTVNPITSDKYPQKARRPAYSVLNTDAFTQCTGIVPRPWPQALRDYLYRFTGNR